MTTIEQVIKEMHDACDSYGQTGVIELATKAIREWATRLDAEVASWQKRGPVAWTWGYIGPDPYVKNCGMIARLVTEMDPANPPYPDTWKPVAPLFAAPPPPSGDAGKEGG